MQVRIAVTLAAVALSLTAGCATVTKGSSQPITLHTDPDGATCDIVREAKTVASVGATPGQATVDKAWGAIDVKCRKSGYQSTEVKVDSEVQGWTFGNILLGGLIGFAVDAASGAMRQYPQFITLTLVPEEFESAATRDEYVKRTLARFEKEAAEAKAEIEKRCSGDACADELKSLDALKEKRIELLRARVDAARIKPAAQSSGLWPVVLEFLRSLRPGASS
jgi:hypothetical protein